MTRTRLHPIRAFLFVAGSFVCSPVQSADPAPSNPADIITAPPAALEAIRKRTLELEEEALKHPHQDRIPVPRDYVKPPSAWQSSEKIFYENLLAEGRFDVLVVPFQVQDYAVDRGTRSLMTAELAVAIGATGKKVPDPYLVARALGDGERRFAQADVSRLANRLGATRVVWGYVGQFRNNKLRLTIQHQETTVESSFTRTGPVSVRHFEDLSFSDEDPPIDVFRRLLPDILKTIAIDPPAPALLPESRFDSAIELPLSPLGLVSDRGEPARDAYYLQLLAALTPRRAERTRERLIEKSMLAIFAMSPASPDYRVLKARAYMGLGLRPAALKALGEQDSDEAKHLRAMLNGNLPDVERYSARIKPGVRAFLAKLELNEIASTYKSRTQQNSLDDAAALKLAGHAWPYLAARAFTDWDTWSQHQNSELKILLDREFPIASFTAERIVRGAASLGDLSKAQTAFDLSVLDHVRRYSETQRAIWCCEPVTARLTRLDYLVFLDSLGTDNLLRRAHLIARTQGLPQEAIEFLARIDSVYKDQPQLTVERARAEVQLARRANGAEKDGLFKAAFEHARIAFYWEQGQTRNAAEAWDVMISTNRGLYFENIYAADRPFHPFYPSWEHGGNMELQGDNERAALVNSTVDFRPVNYLAWAYGEIGKKLDKVDQLLQSIDGRFAGNPNRAPFLAKEAVRKGNFKAAQGYYREDIKSQPRRWQSYAELGRILFEEADTGKAAQVFMSYPEFVNRADENAVALSNHAFDAGSLFYWSGHFDRAMPLYRIAAGLQTGSNASMSSEIRLNLATGDYSAALTKSLERARRYNTAFAYRDYLGMLHTMGRSQEAWDAFGALIVQMPNSELWETPLVGHRIEGATESEIAGWVARDPMRKSGYSGVYLLRAGVTDRTPTPNLATAIVAVERPVWKLEGELGTVREAAGGGNYLVLNNPRLGVLPIGVFDRTKKIRVKSDLVYFAEAYRAIRARDFARANTLLEEALTLYDTRQHDLGYLLAYYAFAAAKNGNSREVSARLDKFDSIHQRFDYHLARAALAGLAGNTAETLKNLNLARHRRPFTQSRPVYTEYQFAEICEWLYEETRNVKYREVALDWAKSVEGFSPWFAWSYAIEAELSTDKDARRRAIATAYYLDKQSERLAKLPKDEIDAAVKAFADRNIFLTPRAAKKEAST